MGKKKGNRHRGHGSQNRGRGNGFPNVSLDDEDFSIQMFADAPQNAGVYNFRGGRGGFRGGDSQFRQGTFTPYRGRGRANLGSPFGRGRGYNGGRRGDFGIGASPRGRGRGTPTRPGTLSGLLYQERPLLRPVTFVPSVHTRVLFQENEEIFKPGVEEVDDTEQSHVPTAEQVSRVFSGGDIPRMDSSSDDENEDEEEIAEVDFHDVGMLFELSSSLKKTTTKKSKIENLYQEPTGISIPNPRSIMQESNSSPFDYDVHKLTAKISETLSATDDKTTIQEHIASSAQKLASSSSNVNPQPSVTSLPQLATKFPNDLSRNDAQPSPLSSSLQNTRPPDVIDDEDDEIIVYVAPHPRNSVSRVVSVPKESEQADTSRFTPYESLSTLHVASSASPSFHTITPQPGPYTSEPPPQTAVALPLPPSPSSPFSFSFSNPNFNIGSVTVKQPKVPPVTTPRQAKVWKRKQILIKKRIKFNKSTFGSFGAMREEALLHNEDPRHSERRRGDSDLEWGDKDNDAEVGDAGSVVDSKVNGEFPQPAPVQDKGKHKAMDIENNDDDDHGMQLDPDLDPNINAGALQTFAVGLVGSNAGIHSTIDDLRDEERMILEDEEGDFTDGEDPGSGVDASLEDIFPSQVVDKSGEDQSNNDDDDDDDSGEEEGDDEDDEDDEDSEDDEFTPRSSFEARLKFLRKHSKLGKLPSDVDEDDDDIYSDDGVFLRYGTKAEKYEDHLAHYQDLLDGADAFGNRKERRAFFKSMTMADDFVDDYEEFSPSKRKKDQWKDLPAYLRTQWEKDRRKKAEYKQRREQARLEAAADPLSKKKGGKKGRKAMLVAASVDPTITVIPNRIIDMVTLVQQIQRFLGDIGGPATMALPPTNKATRKNIHDMAQAFNLKSESKGDGDARYTTLYKTSRSGLPPDEIKIAKIVRRSGRMATHEDSFVSYKKGNGKGAVHVPRHKEGDEVGKGKGKGAVHVPRHKEGDEVGKAAPKLDNTNIGFRMLSLMGWSEGNRIGFTGGLDVPLTAIIKHTKLGLGATKSKS